MNQHNTEVSELVRQNIGNVLQCVFDTGSKYGRTTIARILTGTVDVRILTANSEAYGSMKAFIIKDVLEVIDWAIENNYLAYVEDSEFPVLVCTSKGLNVLSGYDKTFSLPMDRPVQYDNEDKEIDDVFIKSYLKGRKHGLSLTDAIRSAEGDARSRLATLQGR